MEAKIFGLIPVNYLTRNPYNVSCKLPFEKPELKPLNLRFTSWYLEEIESLPDSVPLDVDSFVKAESEMANRRDKERLMSRRAHRGSRMGMQRSSMGRASLRLSVPLCPVLRK